MKTRSGDGSLRVSSTSWLLSVLVLLCGCGGGGGTSGPIASPSAGSTPAPTPASLVIAGNWHFSTTSTVSGTPAVSIDGSINQSGSSLRGAVHVDGSNCFDRLTTVGLTGTLNGSNISLTSTSVAGQVTTFTGSITNDTLTGTYTINGGCANGDQGSVAGIKIPHILNTLNATFTTSGGDTFDVAGNVVQDASASSEGSFGITGTVSFRTSCFSSGTITPGTFPSGSFIMGRSVALKIETGNGTLAFLGTENLSNGEISGNYTVSGGTCDQSGTALFLGPFDY